MLFAIILGFAMVFIMFLVTTYLQYSINADQRYHQEEIIKLVISYNERILHNTIVSLKSSTVEDYINTSILPPVETEEKEEEEDETLDLLTLSEENPEEFDKKVLGDN